MWSLTLLAAVATSVSALAVEPASPITIALNRATRSGINKRNIPLLSFADVLYYGNGTVRKQTFQFLFDTGSSDVVLPGPICAWIQCGQGEKYDEGGKNLSKEVTLPYASGQVIGNLFEDSLTVDGKTAKSQVLVSAEVNTLLQDSDVNGIIGLGFGAAAGTKATPFFDNLIEAGAVPKPEIGMYVGSISMDSQHQGELVLGGRNPKHFEGPVTELPVVDEFYWTVALDQVSIGGKCVGNATRNNHAAIDSGTQGIVGPKAAVKELFAAIPGAHITKNKTVDGAGDVWTFYVLPCNVTQNQMPSLVMGGRPFPISLDAMVDGESADEPGMCNAKILGANAPSRPKALNEWIVGDTFLRSYYAIYSHKGSNGKPSVSLARVKH